MLCVLVVCAALIFSLFQVILYMGSCTVCFFKENVCSSCHCFGDQCGEFLSGLLDFFGFFSAAFAFPQPLWWHPQTTDMDVTKLFLCSSVVVFNFAVAVLGTLKFTSRGAASVMEKVGLITTCRENKKSSSSGIPGNSHLGYCWQTAWG